MGPRELGDRAPAQLGREAFARLGGESGVRRIVEEMVARMADDLMIGFFFRRTQLPRLVELEYAHAAAFLGGPVAYPGRPMGAAHRRLGIRAGHLARRLHILADILDAHRVPPDLRAAWLAHQRAQTAAVLGQEAPASP